MCGICGIAAPSPLKERIDPRRLTRMRDELTHRGPDGAGQFIGESVGLGHRRLSIVDVRAGHQPMTSEDGTIQIVFNGEIYNHRALRPDLIARGHQYRTASDTETIIHLYEEYGAQCVHHLRGMFAFAIWDAPQRTLLLARDRLGIKPLYYTLDDQGRIAFASEIKALLVARVVRAELNYAALPDHLANYASSGASTLFANVHRLLPGHTLVWREGKIEITRYWDVSFAPGADEHTTNERQIIGEWLEEFRGAVQSHLMADVPLGMFLSGGIDSSAIAAVMSGMVAEPIKTFSVGFAEKEANELSYARLVARTFGTEHHEIIVSADDYFAALPQLIWQEDEPLAHLASVPLYFVSRLAARHVKVVLTGEGSDELLAGYGRYVRTVQNLRYGLLWHQYTSASARRAFRCLMQFIPSGKQIQHKLMRTFLYRSPDLESLYLDNFAVFPREMQSRMLARETQEQAGGICPYTYIQSCLNAQSQAGVLHQLLYADLKTYLHELLMKQDQMSMAASLESRVPFLDHVLVERTTRMPERLKLRGWTTKYILRQAMKGLLPAEIITRPKMGFPVPVGRWLRTTHRGMLDEYVLSERARRRGLFVPEFTRRLVTEHVQRQADHTQRLWALVNLEMWMREFLDGEILHQPTTTLSPTHHELVAAVS